MTVRVHRHKKQEEDGEDWIISYSDVVTLLLCFFVLLASVSQVNVVAYEQLQSEMRKGIAKDNTTKPIELLIQDIKSDVSSLDASEKVSIGSDFQGVFIDLASSSFFDSGSADLKPEAEPVLKRIFSTLKSERYNSFAFEVQGHTDDVPITTALFPSNWELSAARASAIVRYMISRGINPLRLKAVGFADIQPKVPNNDVDGNPSELHRSINRRVTVRIEPIINTQ